MLTPAEEAELQQLESMAAQKPAQKSGLTPEEENELAQLEQVASGQKPQEQDDDGNDLMRALLWIGKKIGQGASFAGTNIDRISGGASFRNAMSTIGTDKSAGQAAVEGFSNPDTVPGGVEIAEQNLGLSNTPYYEKAFGKEAKTPEEIDIEANPLNYKYMDQRASGAILKKISPANLAGTAINLTDLTTAIPVLKLAGAGKGLGKIGSALKGSVRALEDVTLASRPISSSIEYGQGVVKGAKNFLSDNFVPKVSKDFPKLKSIAEKNGIDVNLLPESVEFGKRSPISRKARSISEGPYGAERIAKFEEGYSQLNNAYNKKIQDISGGAILNEREAGDLIKTGYNNAVNRLFNGIETTDGAIIKQFGPDSGKSLFFEKGDVAKLNSKLKEIESVASRKLRSFSDGERAQGKQLMDVIQRIGEKPTTFDSMKEVIEDIGTVAFKKLPSQMEVRPDTKSLRELYGVIREGMNNSVRTVDPKLADGLMESNKALSEFFGKKSILAPIIENERLAPEGVFKNLILNTDSKKLETLKSVLSPEEFNPLKGTFIDAISKRNPEGNLLFGSTYNSLKTKKNIAPILLNKNELDEIGELFELGDAFGIPFLSTSGTGGSVAFQSGKDFIKEIRMATTGEASLASKKVAARGRGVDSNVVKFPIRRQALKQVQIEKNNNNERKRALGLQ